MLGSFPKCNVAAPERVPRGGSTRGLSHPTDTILGMISTICQVVADQVYRGHDNSANGVGNLFDNGVRFAPEFWPFQSVSCVSGGGIGGCKTPGYRPFLPPQSMGVPARCPRICVRSAIIGDRTQESAALARVCLLDEHRGSNPQGGLLVHQYSIYTRLSGCRNGPGRPFRAGTVRFPGQSEMWM